MSRGGWWDLGLWSRSITIPQILSNIPGLGVPAPICSPYPGAETERQKGRANHLVDQPKRSHDSFQVSIKTAERDQRGDGGRGSRQGHITVVESRHKFIKRLTCCLAMGPESVKLWVAFQMGNQGTFC